MKMVSRLALPALLLLAACKGHDAAPTVTAAWVRLPAVTGQPAAAYFTLHGGGSDATLVKVESTLAQRADMHQSMTGTGMANMPGMSISGAHAMAGMAPLDHVAVPAGGTVAFAPGGAHVMLYGLDKVVAPGTAVPLRFGFADGRTAEAEAKTVAAGDGAPY